MLAHLAGAALEADDGALERPVGELGDSAALLLGHQGNGVGARRDLGAQPVGPHLQHHPRGVAQVGHGEGVARLLRRVEPERRAGRR